MALARRPHSAVHYPVTKTTSSGRVDVPTDGTAKTIRCQITPMNAESAFRTFGGDISLSQPHLMLVNIDAYTRTIKSADKVVYGGFRFYVNAAPMIWEAGVSTDCIQILLEKEMHQ